MTQESAKECKEISARRGRLYRGRSMRSSTLPCGGVSNARVHRRQRRRLGLGYAVNFGNRISWVLLGVVVGGIASLLPVSG